MEVDMTMRITLDETQKASLKAAVARTKARSGRHRGSVDVRSTVDVAWAWSQGTGEREQVSGVLTVPSGESTAAD
jgi:hypothetical protein